MKTKPTPPPEDSDQQLDSVLGARLRSTSPEFERRFDELRRRLANEEPSSIWLRWWRTLRLPEAGVLRIVTVGAAMAMIAVVTFVSLRYTDYPSAEPLDTAAFIELAALEESLSPALALTDPEALEVLLNIPLN